MIRSSQSFIHERNGRTFHDRDCIVFPVSEARKEVFYTGPSLEFVVKDVAFVEENNYLRLCE